MVWAKEKGCLEMKFVVHLIMNRLGTTTSRLNTAISDRYAHTALEELLPNADWSTEDCVGQAADARTQGQQPSRRIHLNENPQFCERYLPLVLERDSSVAYNGHSTLFVLVKALTFIGTWPPTCPSS